MLIDSEKLKQSILTTMPERSEVLLVVNAQPEVIVRCKDCRKRETMYCPFYWRYKGTKYDDWFCADGERSDGDAGH